jgi:tRNA modification GTPase
LSDTAGLREAAEPIEAVGIAIAEQAIERSGIVLWVVDGSIPLAAEDRAIAARLAGRPALVALNKSDRPSRVRPDQVTALLEAGTHRVVAVSATRGDGLESLRGELASMLGAGGDERAAGAAIGNLRHVEALSRASRALERAAAAARAARPGEIVALELREGLNAIGEVTGKTVSEDLLDRIFSRFCIGK